VADPVPRLTVVTVVLNGAWHIEQTIDSVRSQNYPHLEYLVIDGGSTDGTVDILKRHEKALTWISRRDDGMWFAMNEGIRRAKGELVGLIHSDDWYEPGALEIAASEFEASGRAAIVYGMTRYWDARGVDMVLSYDHSRLPERMINHPSCFVPRAVYDRVGVFDTRYRVAADYELLLRAFRMGVPFRHVERILANFRSGGFSSRHSSGGDVLRAQLQHGYLTRSQYMVKRARRAARDMLARVARVARVAR
jgi:glycosyltransferase involved in cell wall biosynthesis